MADEPKTTSKGGSGMPREVENALWGALLTGGLGAVAGGLATNPDEELTPGEQFKQRLKNALLVGLMGAAGGGGAGYLLTTADIIGSKGGDSDDKPKKTPEQLNNEWWQRNGGAAAGAAAGALLSSKIETGVEHYLNDGKLWKPKYAPTRWARGVLRYGGPLTVAGMAGTYAWDRINDYQNQAPSQQTE